MYTIYIQFETAGLPGVGRRGDFPLLPRFVRPSIFSASGNMYAFPMGNDNEAKQKKASEANYIR